MFGPQSDNNSEGKELTHKGHGMDYHNLLRNMLLDMEQAPPCFQPTNFWKFIIPAIVRDLQQYGFEAFRSTSTATSLWAAAGKLEDEQVHYITFLSNDNDEKAPHIRGFSENLTGRLFPPFKFGDRNYTPTSLSYLKGLAFLKKHVDTSIIKNVIEIGGGYGCLGEILLKSTPEQIFYVNVDIPPISAVATYYLQSVFGKDVILDYSQSSVMEILDIEEIRKKYRGMVICPWQLPKIKGSFELAVNYVSFQEMEPEVVKNYVTYLNSMTSHYVLMRNSRYGKQVAAQPYTYGVIKQTTREDYLNFFSPFQLVALDCKTFGYFTPPNFESEVIILERKKYR